MTATKDMRASTNVRDSHIPAKYIQLPTMLSICLKNYFSVSSQAPRWLPSVADLRFRDNTTALAEEHLDKTIEISRFETYFGNATNATLPKILLRRGAVAVTTPGPGTGPRSGMDGPGGIGGVLARQYGGAITSFCLSKQTGQAELIAAEVEAFYSAFLFVLQCELNINRLFCSQVGDVMRLKEFPDFFAVPVVVDYLYEDNTVVSRTDILVRSIQLSLQ